MSPFVHFGLLITCSVLAGCITNKGQRNSMADEKEQDIPGEVKKSDEYQSDMNVIMCWVCKKSVHQIKGLVFHEIEKEIKAVCQEMKILHNVCEKHAEKYQLLILHLLFPGNSYQTCQHLSLCK